MVIFFRFKSRGGDAWEYRKLFNTRISCLSTNQITTDVLYMPIGWEKKINALLNTYDNMERLEILGGI
jgi:hypothetical protein